MGHRFLQVIILSFFTFSVLKAQLGLMWAKSDATPNNPKMASSSYEEVFASEVDNSGNVYVLGRYYQSGTTGSGYAVGLFKYNPDGALAWKSFFFLRSQSLLPSKGIEVTPDGVYIAASSSYGFGSDTMYYVDNSGNTKKSFVGSSSTQNIFGFVAKLDLTGNTLWVSSLLKPRSKSDTYCIISDIAANSSNVYLAGSYSSSGDIRVGNCSTSANCSSGSVCMLPTNYLASEHPGRCTYGNDYHYENPFLFGLSIGSGLLTCQTSPDFKSFAGFNGIYADQNNVYAVGSAYGYLLNPTGPYGCASGPPSLMDMNGYDAMLFKYTTYLYPIWYGKIGGNGSESARDITSYNGELFITYQSYSYPPYTTTTSVLCPSASYNFGSGNFAFLANVDNNPPLNTAPANRNLCIKWVQPLVGANTSGSYSYFDFPEGNSLKVDATGNIYTTFSYYGNSAVKYYSSPISGTVYPQDSGLITTVGSYDIGFAKYSNNGNLQFIKTLGSNSSEIVNSISTDGQSIFIGGYFSGTTDFEPSPAVFNSLTSLGSYDGFIAKYGCFPVDITTRDTVFCFNTPITLNAVTDCPTGACNFNYVWSDPVGGGSISTIADSLVITGSTGTIQRNLTMSNSYSGCTVTDDITLQIQNEVTISVFPLNQTVCPGSSVTFTANVSPVASTVLWYNSSGTLVNTGLNFTTSVPATYTVVAKFNGCTKSTNITLSNHPVYSPRLLPANPIVCGGSGFIEVLDCPGCSYNWTAPPGSSASSSSNLITIDIAGTYQVDVIDPNGCVNSFLPVVTNQQFLLSPIIAKDVNDSIRTVICNGSPLVLETIPFSTCPTCTYEWSDGSTGPYTFAFNTGTFTVTVTNTLTGCRGVSVPLSIRTSSLLAPLVNSNPYNICQNVANGVFSNAAVSVSSPSVNLNYQWKNQSGTAIASGITADISSAGDFYVTARDSLGCTENSQLFSIGNAQYTTPLVSSTGNNACGSNTVSLSTVACSGCNYQWNQTINGASIPVVGATNPFYNTTLADTFSLTVRYANSCQGLSANVFILSDTFTPVVNTLDTVNFICNNDPIDLAVTGPAPVLTPPAWSYQWYLNGNTITGSTGHVHRAVAPGTYHVLVSRPDGCSSFSNFFTVNASSVGANPSIVATPSIYRCGGANVTLTAPPCTSCIYTWRDADGIALSRDTFPNNDFVVNISRGYYVEITDSISRCTYQSPVIEIKDTILQTPSVNVASSTNICSTSPVILSTSACAGCTYVWEFNGASGTSRDTVNQNTFSANTTGNYSVQVIQNGCASAFSGSVPITRLSFNAQLSSPPIASICNGDTATLLALPGLAVCPDCQYTWYQNGIVIPLPNTQDNYDVIQGGDYYVVVKQTFPGFTSTPYTFGCRDSTVSVSFSNVAVMADLSVSPSAICGPSGQVTLRVDSCLSCTYAWFFDGDTSVATGGGLNYLTLSGANDTFYLVNGTAATGMYKVRVTKNGCMVYDSVYLPPVAALTYTIDTSSTPFANICGGTPITLSANCATCSNYQWYLNNTIIPGAIGASHLAVTGGNYQLLAGDLNGCITASPVTTVSEVLPPAGFSLNLDPVGVVPLSFGNIALDAFLTPSSLHALNSYSSVPQPSAIMAGDTFSPMNAGSGPHLISYTYNQQNCSFVTSDTIQVLSQLTVDVINTRAVAPPYEACITDSLRFLLSNFTFAPNQILFPISSVAFDTVNVSTAGLTQFAGVFSGAIGVRVPDGAVTGKVFFRNQQTGLSFQAPFFLVVQNPDVAIGLNGVSLPLCSNYGTVALSGFPSPGLFEAAYTSSPGTNQPTLISGTNLNVNNVTGYDPLTGYQTVKLTYKHTPTYTTGIGNCPTVSDSINVQINNIKLDSVEFTPISQTVNILPMTNLTRLVWPLENRNFSGNYTGTYITSNNLLAGTLPFLPLNSPPLSVSDPVIYSFTNGNCSNSITKNIDVWRKPSILDSIPQWICQNADSIIIQRTSTGLNVRVLGSTSSTIDNNYVFAYNSRTNTNDFAYDEFINKMTLTSSNGGLVALNLTPGAERYALIPSQITAASTDLTLTFDYERTLAYFTPVASNSTTNYTIASVTKTINVEAPFTAQINPAILQDPVFCQDNSTQQFSGIPNGGQYYLNNQILASNLFNPNAQAVIHGNGQHTLKYVFRGNACQDSTTTVIVIPAPFSVTITAPNGPDYCQDDAPDLISVSSSNQGLIDSTAGIFYVGNTISGQVFNPGVAPAAIGPNQVIYVARDTFGCSSSDTTFFNVFAVPELEMDTLAAAYCLNELPINFDLYERAINNTSLNGDWHLQTHGYANPLFPNISVTLSGRGFGGTLSNPVAPVYSPLIAGGPNLQNEIRDTVVYSYTNTLTGCSSSISQITRIKPLPKLTLTTTNGDSIRYAYCEKDTVPIFATPASPGNIGFFSQLTNNPGGSNFNLNVNPPRFEANIPGIAPAFATEIIAYTFQDPFTLCRDTIRDTIIVKNFLTEPIIVGLPNNICANNVDSVLTINLNGGVAITSGAFGAQFSIDSAMITPISFDSSLFNPFYSGIYDTERSIIVKYTYQSNGTCTNTILDTCLVKPLPQLSFVLPGDTLFNSNDPVYHICFNHPLVNLFASNTYRGVTSPLQQFKGTYYTYSGLGIQRDPQLLNWNYLPDSASPGLDSIYFTYTDSVNTFCSNTHVEPIIKDTVPRLGFAGFDISKLDASSGRYVYCQNDISHLVIPTPFGGRTYWNYNNIPSILFELVPDTLVINGQTTVHMLTYEFISARYQNGGVCLDSINQQIEVRPTPILTFSTAVPDFYCVSDSNQRLVLSASPAGGVFEDVTNGVISGIVADSFFNPIAQLGVREITYSYRDNISGCRDTLEKIINVYNQPEAGYSSGGGCQGDPVLFSAKPTGLSDSLTAIDALTMVVWNYGDGNSDTLTSFSNPIVIPDISHVYASAGVYYPKLTIVNQGTCPDSIIRRIVVSPKFTVNDTTPYLQDFQSGTSNWFQENGDPDVILPTDSLWEWGIAQGARINTTQESNFVWITDLDSSYSQNEKAWVYSPCFDISALRRPMVALDIWRDSREGVDGTVLQYYDVLSLGWKNLGVRNKGLNWYNPSYIISMPGEQTGIPVGWSGSSNGWEDARYRLDVQGGDLRGSNNLRFRLAFASSPNSVIANLEGFAFDNFYVGNRSRSVLLEHFSNQNFAGIARIDTTLYDLVYSNLYGRDVSMIQYQTEYNSADPLHQESVDESNSRVLYYGINNSNQIRINGQSLVNNSSDLYNGNEELLDMQMLRDAEFKIKLNPISIQNGIMTINTVLSTPKDLPVGDYALHAVVTEDSLVSVQNHKMISVVRSMRPDPSGTTLASLWIAGQSEQHILTWDYGSVQGVNYNPNNLKVVVFVQNRVTKEVYQVATSRNLNIFNGPVAVEETEAAAGPTIFDLNLYPNPTQNDFTVEFEKELESDFTWRVTDMIGQVLRSGKAESGTSQFSVETENLSPGMYIFSINNGQSFAQRMVIIAK